MKALLVLLTLSIVAVPAVANTVTLKPVKDSYVCDCLPTVTNPGPGGSSNLGQGEVVVGGCHHSLCIQFDISNLDPGETINGAELQLLCNSAYGSFSGDTLYSRVIEDWDEDTVNFNNKPDNTDEGQIVAGWASAATWQKIDVTEFVTKWYDGTADNFGIRGHDQNTTGVSDMLFHSSNSSVPEKRPKLVIDYTGSAIEAESFGTIKATLK